LTGDGWKYRYVVVRDIKSNVIPFPLLANITQGIFSTAFVVFVKDDQISEIEHVDFFELTGCTVFAGHDIDREIHHIDNFTITLADTRGFHDDHIESQRLQEQNVIT